MNHSSTRRRRKNLPLAGAPCPVLSAPIAAMPPGAAPNDTPANAAAAAPVSAFWITDFAFHRVVYVSHGYEVLWGRSCASLYAKPQSFFDTIHPSDRERVVAHYARQKQGVPLDLEYRILRPDRSIRWVWDRRSPMGDSSEQVYAGMAQDITHRKQAEQTLLRHDMFVQSSREAIISQNLEGVMTAWNPAAEALFGYSAAEAVGKSVMLIVPHERAEEEATILERITRGEKLETVDTQRRHRDGRLLELSLTMSPLIDREERIVGVATICRDHAKEKAATAALLESERCFRETFDAASVGLAQVALDGRVVRVNAAFCAMTGYPRETLLNQTLDRLTDVDDRPVGAAQWRDLQSGRTARYSVEKRLLRRNGFSFWAELTLTAVPNAAGDPSYAVVVVQDLTSKHELAAQLRHAQKMETIGHLASGVAHDFNNVLGYVTMRSELTCTYPNLPANVLADLQQIKAAANRATHLTRQLLTFSRNEHATRPQRLDLNELMSATVKMVQRLLGENLVLEVQLQPKPIVVHLDPGIIDQVLLNLAINARDAMPEGGTLTIETTEYVVPDWESRPSPEVLPGTYACVRVSDTGTGITAENMPHIFEPFFTTKERGRGTGLGLAMVQTLVQQNRGWITVESKEGVGTTFRVYLPVDDAVAPSVPEDEVLTALPGGNETILLVEDETDLRKAARMALQLQGYHVLEAAGGAEALEVWGAHRDEIALVFTDMVLPDGLGGRALAARALSDKPAVKVLFTTGYSPDEAGHEVTLHDGQNFLPKPYSVERLLKVVRASLGTPAK